MFEQIESYFVIFWSVVEALPDGRWRYLIHACDHFIFEDGREQDSKPYLYETGPACATEEAARLAGQATVSYYEYLHPVEYVEGAE